MQNLLQPSGWLEYKMGWIKFSVKEVYYTVVKGNPNNFNSKEAKKLLKSLKSDYSKLKILFQQIQLIIS